MTLQEQEIKALDDAYSEMVKALYSLAVTNASTDIAQAINRFSRGITLARNVRTLCLDRINKSVSGE